jgi:hypothetical protein
MSFGGSLTALPEPFSIVEFDVSLVVRLEVSLVVVDLCAGFSFVILISECSVVPLTGNGLPTSAPPPDLALLGCAEHHSLAQGLR